MSRFFIDRPVFAWVIAIIIMLIGLLSIFRLPVEQYPNIAPPSISINVFYPGASAETLENTVTQVIEQSLTGIDNMRYFSATSDSSGKATITVTFDPGTNPDIAQIQVQNKIQAALALLPSEATQYGITVTKISPSFLLVAGFYSEDGSIPQHEISDLLISNIKDPISRINGVGNVTVFGAQHSMRIWLDPYKLLSYNLSTTDVYGAIKEQNVDISAGQIGSLPAAKGQQINATIKVQSLLKTPEDFEKVILRINPNGSQIRLRDVARVELGSEDYSVIVRYKGKPASGIAVSQSTGANSVTTAEAVKERIASLQKFLPSSIKVIYPYDATPFIKLSIKEVVKTLIEAIILVFVIMYLFLQNFRATLIPGIAVPIVLLGTFGVLSAIGFSINILTMFAMVLAIGLLVDDAIVVVENVERIMKEEKISPREATIKSMKQITSALIGITMVLSAVFIPMAFFSSAAGVIYRQFSLTIISAMILSVIVALILSPTLCATLLRSEQEKQSHSKHAFFDWFNMYFNKSRDTFVEGAKYILHKISKFFMVYGISIIILLFLFTSLPTSFLPNEDRGTMFLMATTPSGSSSEFTQASMEKVEDYLLGAEKSSVDHLFTVIGYSFSGIAQNVAFGFVGLKPWDERSIKTGSVFLLARRAMGAFQKIKDAIIFAFYPPPIQELGNSSGFNLQLIDRGKIGHDALMQARNQLLGMAAQNPKLQGVRPTGLSDVAQYKIDVDHEKAGALGLSIPDINQSLQIAWGSSYVNDFLDKNRIKKVYLQADTPYRMMPEDINLWYVRNNQGKMVPFSSFSSSKWTYGSPKLERFNGASSINIQGEAAPGISTGEAMKEIESMVKKLPKGLDVEWVGLSYEEQLAGSQTTSLYILSVIVIFLCLAALYESWAVPFSVILSIPIGIIGTVIAAKLFGLNNDIYFQIGLLTTIGLVSKNSILIVEFAKSLYEKGYTLKDATLTAAKQRFRPIIMTSMAFILGVSPLAFATGAGSASQNAIGIIVIGGMLASTFLAIFFVPMFYVATQYLSHIKSRFIKLRK